MKQELEFWQQGPVEGIDSGLQPVAHAILQARREVTDAMRHLTASMLWQRPAGVASVAFHLQHLTGVLDRLFTYARGEQLTAGQLQMLQEEGKEKDTISVAELVERLNEQVEKSLGQLRQTPAGTLQEKRGIGRKQIPTTVLGLLFHAAEHTQRHTGQLLVTAKIVQSISQFEN